MRRFAPVLIAVITLAGLMGFAAPSKADTAADVAAIEKLYAEWRAAVEAADIPGYVAGLDEDVHLMPPGAADIIGRDTYEAFLQPVFDSATYQIIPLREAVIEVQGDWAFGRYDYEVRITLKNPDQAITEPGALTANVNRLKYFDVLRRTDDGSWKVYRHTWNAMPAIAASEE